MKSTSVGPVRVVVVEDSAVQRAHLVLALEHDGDVAVVGQAADSPEAIAVVARLRPEVVTMDLEIPGGGGQYAIEEIMAHTPTPILVLSGRVTTRRSTAAVEALMAGALDAVPKPDHWSAPAEAAMRNRVRSLRNVAVIRHPRGRLRSAIRKIPAPTITTATRRSERVVAIAASTGGPAALATVLSGLAGLSAPVLVVQHLHPDFVEGLVAWMGRVSALPVELASHGSGLRDGVVYIAPGGTHLKVDKEFRIVLDPLPATTHRPSADELFGSVATHVGPGGIGVVLTGMGDDGTAGLQALRTAGGQTFGQDEQSCAVFGMPRAAQEAGAVDDLLPVDRMAAAILRGNERQGA